VFQMRQFETDIWFIYMYFRDLVDKLMNNKAGEKVFKSVQTTDTHFLAAFIQYVVYYF